MPSQEKLLSIAVCCPSLVVALLLCCAVELRAQPAPATFDLSKDRETIASLDGLWRFKPGDDSEWAKPDWDDSAWPLLRSDRSWARQGYPQYGGFAWYRFTLHLPATTRPQGILLTSIYTGYQVYANGQLIGSQGSFEPSRAPVFAYSEQLFRIPAEELSSHTPPIIHVAIRVWEYQPVASWAGAGTMRSGSEAGDIEIAARHLHWYLSEALLQRVNYYAYALLAFVVGLTVLTLYFFRRSDREYLWFAVLLLMSAADAAFSVAGFAWIRFLIYRLATETFAAVAAIAGIFFFSIVLEIQPSLPRRLLLVAAAVSPLSLISYFMQWTPVGVSYGLELICLLPVYFWIIGELAYRAYRRDESARLLLVPAALLYGNSSFDIVAAITSQFGWQNRFNGIERRLIEAPYPIHLHNIIQIVFVLALLIFLVRRFSTARREEERLSGELEAARGVQSLLVADTPREIPGFVVQSVYLPASEVGGDFFQLLPRADGSLLAVIGDVSGKGLQAAMTVSATMGGLRSYALQTEFLPKPGQVLSHLNEVLHGQINGFVTCCVLLIRPDGTMLLANAGHIPPYLAGLEMAVDGGLPLGIVRDVVYVDAFSRLYPDEQLTLVTDGVVEATNKAGQLYGFERTLAISQSSAQAIAEDARSFGQNDDITILTIALRG